MLMNLNKYLNLKIGKIKIIIINLEKLMNILQIWKKKRNYQKIMIKLQIIQSNIKIIKTMLKAIINCIKKIGLNILLL